MYIDPAHRATFDFNALLGHCRQRLPRYAVPVFIRVLGELTTMHNNKQNKVPLRNDGCDLGKVRERAEREAREARQGTSAVKVNDTKETEKEKMGPDGEVTIDEFYWCPQALSSVKGVGEEVQGFVRYTEEDWEGLKRDGGKSAAARL